MGWNKDETHFHGRTREYLYPWYDKEEVKHRVEERKGEVHDNMRPPPAVREFVKFYQDAGVTFGMFCVCGEELVLEATFTDGLLSPPSQFEYTCPKCNQKWLGARRIQKVA